MTDSHMLIQVFGISGVILLLLAFVLNMLKKLSESNPLYLWMNICGAGLAAVYAFYSKAYPFVVLESVWCAAALVKLLGQKKRAP